MLVAKPKLGEEDLRAERIHRPMKEMYQAKMLSS